MKKILLALTILAVGAGVFHSARQHASQLQQKVQAANESWQIHTQQLAVSQSEKIALTEHVRELKQTVVRVQPVTGSALWAALRTNRADHLPPELRQRLLAELGFTWQSSPDFVVVSKQAVRDLQMPVINNGKLTELAATVLAVTAGERVQIEDALKRVESDFKDWALAHVEHGEPKDDVLLDYTVPSDPAMTVRNLFATRLADAVGRDRVELFMPTAQDWMKNIGILEKPSRMVVRRVLQRNETRLKVEFQNSDKNRDWSWSLYQPETGGFFPPAFNPIFPKGWEDVAKRGGFELPPPPEKK